MPWRGIGAAVLGNLVRCSDPAKQLRDGAIVGAGAVVPFNFVVPPRRMALGIPAKIREGYEVPQGHIDLNTTMYFENGKYYRENLRRLD